MARIKQVLLIDFAPSHSEPGPSTGPPVRTEVTLSEELGALVLRKELDSREERALPPGLTAPGRSPPGRGGDGGSLKPCDPRQPPAEKRSRPYLAEARLRGMPAGVESRRIQKKRVWRSREPQAAPSGAGGCHLPAAPPTLPPNLAN